MKFYHYPHCPFCQRVRLLLELLGIKYEDIVLSYADTETPMKLIGVKMLPIIEFENGEVMAESLDLMKRVNDEKIPEGPLDWASHIVVGTSRYFDLVLPWYLDHYQEFQDFPEGAKYFKEGKEAKRGVSFEELKTEALNIYEANVEPMLSEIQKHLKGDFLEGDEISLADLVLVADLNGLRLIEGLELPISIEEYMRRVEGECGEALLEKD